MRRTGTAAALLTVAVVGAIGLGAWQPPRGEHWRLLAISTSGGEPYDVTVARSGDELDELLRATGRGGVGPVDFATEFVVHLAPPASSGPPGCGRTILRGIQVAGTEVFGSYRRPWWVTGCNDDARYRGYFVAVRRDAVPAGPVTVRLAREPWCAACDETEDVTIRE